MAQRTLSGNWKKVVSAMAVCASLYHIYALALVAAGIWQLRVVHLMAGLTLAPLLFPAGKKSPLDRPSLPDVLLCLAGLGASLYALVCEDGLMERIGLFSTPGDILCALVILILLAELTRRCLGWPLVIVMGIFIVYAMTAPYFPGIFQSKGYSFTRLLGEMLSLEGYYGAAIGASSTFVFLFVLFGAVLRASHVGEFIIDISYAAAGRFRGGPAKVAIFASGLFGTISGHGVANVVTTGSFTIPLMKGAGLRPAFAGAVEAAASAGGAIMPPIMGAAAFLMAELINVPYGQIASAAILPAVLFYLALFLMIDLEAGRTNLRGMSAAELPRVRQVLLQWGHLILPILILLYMLLVEKASPIKSALISSACCVVLSWLKAESRMGPRQIIGALCDAAYGSLTVIIACGAAGVIVSVIYLTGVGIKLAASVIALAGSSLFLALVLTMLVTIVLSMGLPIIGAYIIAGVTLGPALVEMGIPALNAHLFIFYFATMSCVTPPVALNAFAAAGIAGANPMTVGFIAWRLSLTAFIVPFMFIYAPALILQGETQEIILACVTSIVGIWSLAAGLSGYALTEVRLHERLLFLAAAFLLIFPGLKTDLSGLGCLGLALALNLLRSKRRLTQGEAA